MKITNLWFTQSRLNRIGELDTLIHLVQNNLRFKTPIEIQESDDGELQIQNGHHRIMSMFICGKLDLDPEDYILVCGNYKSRFGKVDSFHKYYLSRGLING